MPTSARKLGPFFRGVSRIFIPYLISFLFKNRFFIKNNSLNSISIVLPLPGHSGTVLRA